MSVVDFVNEIIDDLLVGGYEEEALEVTSRCSGVGRQYESAVVSALTAPSDAWEALCPGVFITGRICIVLPIGNALGYIITSGGDQDDRANLFILLTTDVDALWARMNEVALTKAADLLMNRTNGDDVPIGTIGYNRRYNRPILGFDGVPIAPDGRDRRRGDGYCRNSRATCSECGPAARGGGIAIRVTDKTVEIAERIGKWGRRHFLVPITPERSAETILEESGLKPVQEFVDGVAWCSVEDAELFKVARQECAAVGGCPTSDGIVAGRQIWTA